MESNNFLFIIIGIFLLYHYFNNTENKTENNVKENFDESKNTEFMPYMNDSSIHLKNHVVYCNSNILGGFGLEFDKKNSEFRYKYNCNNHNNNFLNKIEKNTEFSNDGGLINFNINDITYKGGRKIFSFNYDIGGDLRTLDKHDVKCDDNSVLSEFYLTLNPFNIHLQRYNYTCRKSKYPLKCRSVETKPYDANNGSLQSLEKHQVYCNNNEFLSGFKLAKVDDNSIKYKYTCCSFKNILYKGEILELNEKNLSCAKYSENDSNKLEFKLIKDKDSYSLQLLNNSDILWSYKNVNSASLKLEDDNILIKYSFKGKEYLKNFKCNNMKKFGYIKVENDNKINIYTTDDTPICELKQFNFNKTDKK